MVVLPRPPRRVPRDLRLTAWSPRRFPRQRQGPTLARVPEVYRAEQAEPVYAAHVAQLSARSWRALREALDRVEAAASFGAWTDSAQQADGTWLMPYATLSHESNHFLRTFAGLGFHRPFDWMDWGRGRALARNPELLEEATPAEAAMLIVALLRSDRFVEGTLLDAFDDGLIQRATRRLLTAAPDRDGDEGSALVIRVAKPTEYDAIGELLVAAYRELPPMEGSDAYFARLRDVAGRAAASEVLVAVKDDRVVGGVTFVGHGGPMVDIAGEDEAEIRMLAVDPASQGLGVGKALTLDCIERARAIPGCRRIVLSTRTDMATARVMYERLGFERLPDRDWSPIPELTLLAYGLELERRD